MCQIRKKAAEGFQLNAAASRVHSVMQAYVTAFLISSKPEYVWANELDIKVGPDQKITVQADITGLKGDVVAVAVEIAATSFERDSRTKMNLYRDAGIGHYVIVDCVEAAVYVFELNSAGEYVTPNEDPFPGLLDVIKKRLHQDY